ncbi:MAG: hypothetical protein KC434_11510, partial [Anaerolineales bacterium]|nr:hypothetical protein [Anaerolineales bacterium]
MMKITAVQIEPSKLHKLLVGHFNLDELRTLCFDLQLDFEELPPGGKSAVARELVEYCQRRRLQVALAEAVLEHRPRISSNEFTRDISFSNAPFKGMLAFEEADEEIFFGREELTAELVTRVYQPSAGSVRQLDPSPNLREDFSDPTNFLAIVGASGSGKSSVVKAGMIPHLRRQTNWPIHLITPTAHPLEALATSLTRDSESVTATATLLDDLQKESRALRLYAARLLQNSPADRLLFIIDQFEELFTLCKDDAARTAFVENLVEGVADDSQITILLTLRADFYHHCLQYQPLHHLLEARQKIVPAMSSTELRAAIELPAQQANLTFDEGLVDILLRDVGATDNQTPEPGALPLLSHALLETWQRRDPSENRLTLAGYTEAGGVQGAIAKTAESTYQHLPADQQKIARSIFLRLTELGEGTQDTRRRAALAELLPQKDGQTTVEQVLKTLADARLLTTSEEGAEVAHEALIREWPTLQSWLDEDRDGLRLHRQLTEAAQAWQIAQKDASYLYRGGRLAQINEWLKTVDAALNQLEGDFVEASQQLQRDELADANARAEREADAAQKLRQRAIFLRGALVLAAALSVVAFLLFGNANRSATAARNAEATTQVENIARITAEAEAIQNARLAETRAADAEDAEAEAVQSAEIATTREAEALAAQDFAEAAQFESERQRQIALAQSVAALSNVVLDRNNDTELATLLAIEGAERNWQSAGHADWLIDSVLRSYLGAQPFFNNTFTEYGPTVASVAFSPDGERLASGSADGTIRLWELDESSTESVVLRGSESFVWSVTFSPDGQRLASGGDDGTVRLWNLSDLNVEPVVLTHDSSVLSVAFSPGGDSLASVSYDGLIRLWNLSDFSAEPVVLTGDGSSISSVAFSPGGDSLATGSNDGLIRLWNLGNLSAEPVVLAGHDTAVLSVVFSPDGSRLASGDAGGTIRLWEAGDANAAPVVLGGHRSSVWSVMFSPDGSRLASGGIDQLIRLWDMTDFNADPVVLSGHESVVRSVAFSPDGKRLVSGSADGIVRLWELGKFSAESAVLRGHESNVWSVAFSPDGNWLASSGADGTIRLWNLADSNADPMVLL